MKVSAKVDYALQAVVEIAFTSSKNQLISTENLAQKNQIPKKFLEGILTSLKKSGLITSHRGPNGGFKLSKNASEISVADVYRAIDGPLAEVRGEAPEKISYKNNSKNISKVWIATRVNLRRVLEQVSIQNILEGKFDSSIEKLLSEKEAWYRK
jgi:Rrf2 family protein